MHRRRLLQWGSSALLAPTLIAGCHPGAMAGIGDATSMLSEGGDTLVPGQRRLTDFGLQLSTLTPLMLANFEGTLETVAAIGYSQVEFSAMGFLGRTPQRVQELLNNHGLTAPVGRITPSLPAGFNALPRAEAMQVYRARSHPDRLLENVKYSLEGATVLGQKYLNLPALMPDQFQSMDQVKQNIEQLNHAGELCADAGVLFGYHNHDWELTPIDGVIPYQLMLSATEADKVGFQLDAYWIVKGGGDLTVYLNDHPGRFPSCHLKDITADGDFEDVGYGQINFAQFIPDAQASGTHHFFVERDNPPAPEASIRRSYTYLNNLRF